MWIRLEVPPLTAGVSVDIGPLMDLPDDRDAWIANVLLAERPADSSVRRIATQELAHVDAWPLTVIVAAVVDASGHELERRVVFMFRLEVRGGLVIARIAPSAIAAWEGGIGRALVERLLAAPIRLHGDEVVALAELLN